MLKQRQRCSAERIRRVVRRLRRDRVGQVLLPLQHRNYRIHRRSFWLGDTEMVIKFSYTLLITFLSIIGAFHLPFIVALFRTPAGRHFYRIAMIASLIISALYVFIRYDVVSLSSASDCDRKEFEYIALLDDAIKLSTLSSLVYDSGSKIPRWVMHLLNRIFVFGDKSFSPNPYEDRGAGCHLYDVALRLCAYNTVYQANGDGGFYAKLYVSHERKEVVVAFRGSGLRITDWIANFRQYLGFESEYYTWSVNLAKKSTATVIFVDTRS